MLRRRIGSGRKDVKKEKMKHTIIIVPGILYILFTGCVHIGSGNVSERNAFNFSADDNMAPLSSRNKITMTKASNGSEIVSIAE